MYIENPDEDKLKSQSSSSPSIGAGGGGTAVETGGNPSTISPVQPNQPDQKFATVQDYLKANQPQGEAFGQQFVSTVGQGVGQAKSAVDTSAQKAQNEISTGTIEAKPELINEALKTPTSVANDQEKFAEFQKEYNAQYGGPTSFESSDQYTNAANAANTAAQTGAELGSTGGREQLLQDVFGVYGQGNKGLDQTLLQNSSAYPQVPPLAQNFQSVQDYLKSAAGTTNTAATKAATTTAATKAAATTPFANNLTSFQANLNTRVDAAKAAAQTATDQYKKDFAAGNADAITKDLQEISKNSTEINSIQSYLSALNKDYGVNPDISNYNNFNPAAQITSANVATPEDYANAAAYQKLTGVNYGGILNPATSAEAGTYKNTGNVNTKDLNTYLQGQVGQRDKETLSGANLIPNMQSIASDPTKGAQLAQTYIDAATRAGVDKSQLQNIYMQAVHTMEETGNLGIMPGASNGLWNNPAIAGQKEFVLALDKYLRPRA